MGIFLGAFDKYVKIVCYFWELFQRFVSIWKLLGAFLTNLENGTEILCYFRKTSEFGRSPEIRGPMTPLFVITGQELRLSLGSSLKLCPRKLPQAKGYFTKYPLCRHNKDTVGEFSV